MKHKFVLAAAVLFVFSSMCYGWSQEGHLIIVRIAESYLTPKTKAAVAELLGKETPCDVAVWADYIRTQPGYEWTKPLHVASVPDNASKFNMERDCKHGCNVSAILKFTDILEKKTASRKEQVEAIKFLFHFVGDIHEPIHVTSRDQDKINGIELKFFSEPISLHKIWDAYILLRAVKTWESYADDLQKKITPEQFAKWSAVTDPAIWADESHAVTVKYAYDIPKDKKIDQAYCDRCLPVLNERLQQGGVRLATRLNAIFDPKPQAPTTAPATGKN